MKNIKSLIENSNLSPEDIAIELVESFQIGTPIGIMKGKHKKKKGYITDIKTVYVAKIDGVNSPVELKFGEFYNDED